MNRALLGIAVFSVITALFRTNPVHAQVPEPLLVSVMSAAQPVAVEDPIALLSKTETDNLEAAAPAPVVAAPVVVEVAEGDTLTKIAEEHATTYKRLYDANPQVADPDLINPKDKITIPAPDAQLTDRPLPQTVVVADVRAKVKYAASSAKPISASVYASGSTVWDQLAKCESGGNWAINTGNGFYGGLQFTLSTWHAVGGSGYPNEASREEQIARAEILLARSGWGQWPACTAKLGLR